MANYDASVKVSAKMNNTDFVKGAEQIEDGLDKIEEATQRAGKKLEGTFDNLSDAAEDYKTRLKDLRNKGFGPGDEKFDNLYVAWKNAANAEREYLAELEKVTEMGKAKAAEKAAKEAEKQAEQQRKLEEIAEKNLQRENKILEAEAAKEAKVKAERAEQERLAQIRLDAVVSNQNLVDLLKEQEYITERMSDLKRAGVADGYQEYDGLKERLNQINEEVRDIQSGYSKAANSAQKCFDEMQKGTKKTNNLLSTMYSRLKGIALSLLVFNWISKGFNAMVSAMQKGFQNLAHYSEEYNKVMSDMKSESATLKNSLAAAFEPIATTIIPYITTLISWLNTAMNYLAQFWAVLGGKSTYTRAKKQVVDYAKSLKEASGSAQGALAAFDEINVLNKDTGSSAGGGTTGTDAFEEVEIDQEKFKWVDWLRDNLDTILGLVELVGLGFLGWKLEGVFLEHLDEILGFFDSAAFKAGVLIAGIALLVSGFTDMVENGINLKNSLMVIAGTFLTVSSVAGVAVGAIAALVAGLVLAVVADWKNFKQMVVEPLKNWLQALLANAGETYEGIKQILKGVIQFVKGVFTADWKLAWTGIKNIFTGIWKAISGVVKLVVNTIIGIINTMVNAIAGAVNAVIRAINSISFTVPDWSPIFAGETIGFNIPTLPTPTNIPYLATGGLVTSSTIANIGEAGREAVLPLDNNTEWAYTLADILGDKIGANRPIVIRFESSLAELGRALKPVIDSENSRVGASLVQA